MNKSANYSLENLPILFLERKVDGTNMNNIGCTLGVVYDQSLKQIAVSLEPPWKSNQSLISCIPTGIYLCIPDASGKHQYFRLLNVPCRDAVEIHVGNEPKELKGCIALGEKWGIVNNQGYISNSKKTLDKIKKDYPNGFLLSIKDNLL